MTSLERRIAKVERRLGVGVEPLRPPVILLPDTNCSIGHDEVDRLLGPCRDWTTVRRQIDAVEAEHERQLKQGPFKLCPPIIIQLDTAAEFAARGLPIPRVGGQGNEPS